jgi:AcrR family transcriptional regulator
MRVEPARERSPTRRQAQAAARREQLLGVALDIFAEKGFRGSTIRDIAHAAGITEGLIYHYFPSKAALLQAVLERYSMMPEIMALIEEMKGIPGRQALLHVSERYYELLVRHSKLATMIFTDAHRDPEMAQAFQEIARPGFEAMLALLNEQIAAGKLRRHDAVAGLRLLHGAIVWYFLTRDLYAPLLPPRDPERFVRAMVETLLSGIGPDER